MVPIVPRTKPSLWRLLALSTNDAPSLRVTVRGLGMWPRSTGPPGVPSNPSLGRVIHRARSGCPVEEQYGTALAACGCSDLEEQSLVIACALVVCQ
jgi:hypothetical protein